MCRSLSKVNDGSCAATLREHCCKSLLWPREPTAAALPRTASRTKSLQEINALFLAVGFYHVTGRRARFITGGGDGDLGLLDIVSMKSFAFWSFADSVLILRAILSQSLAKLSIPAMLSSMVVIEARPCLCLSQYCHRVQQGLHHRCECFP